jgi:hypothetical protein
VRWLAILILLVPALAWGQQPAPKPDQPVAAPATLDREGETIEVPICEPPAKCVPKKDLELFVKLAREKKCLLENDPTFDLDPVNIVIDRDGRVFFSGAEPHPYTLRMNWCDYEVEAKGKVDIIAAMREPRTWGFRFRPKAYIGALPLEALYEFDEPLKVYDLIDAGAMVDFFFWEWANINAAVGFRSLGGGIGFDLTSNFGAYAGYGLTWGDWHHNANLGLWFSFWNPE